MKSYYSSWVPNGTSTVSQAYRTRLDLFIITGTTAQNYSEIMWSFHLENGGARFEYYWSDGHVTINGQKVWDHTYIATNSASSHNSEIMLQSRTGTNQAAGILKIPHSSDGTKSITYSTSFETRNKTNGPAAKYAMTSSGTIDLPTIPQYTSITAFSSSSIQRDRFTISWTAADTVNYWWYSLNDGSTWTAVGNPSSTTASRTITGRSPGTSYNVRVKVRRSVSNLETTSSRLVVTTAHNSTLSSYSAAPVKGSSTAISIAFATSSTGGSATVTAAIGSGSYRTVTSGYQFTGLAANTSYTITYKVKNSSSGYENTYTRTATTHPYPNLNVSAAMVSGSKESYTISFSSVTNANRRYYKIGSADWTYTTSASLTRSITPGSSITIQARAYHTDTQVYGATKSVTITAPAKNKVTNLSVSGTARDRFTIAVTTSENTTQVRLTANGSNYTLTSGTATKSFSKTVTGLTSGTNYTVSAIPHDSQVTAGGTWSGTSFSKAFTTTAFQHPGQATATKLTFHSAKVDLSFPHSVYINGLTTAKSSHSETKTGQSPGSTVSFSFTYKDVYSSASGTRTASVKLDDQDAISSLTIKNNLEAAVENEVTLTMNTKRWNSIEYTLSYRSGSGWLELLSDSTTSLETKITLEEHHVEKILQANITSKQIPLKIETKSKQGSTVASVAKTRELTAIASDNNLPNPSISRAYDPYTGTNPSTTMSVLATNLNTMTINGVINAHSTNKDSGSYIQRIDLIIGGTDQYGTNGQRTNIYTHSGTQHKTRSISYETKVFNNNELHSNSNLYAVVEVTDSRSTTKQGSVLFTKVEYRLPTLVTSASRADYFGDYLIFRNTTVTWTPTIGTFENTLKPVTVTTVGSTTSPLGLNISQTNQSIYAEEIEYRRPGHPNTNYSPGSVYEVIVKAIDAYNKEATVSILIPSGQTPLFIDQDNFQVGIGTSNPMALLDVDGEFVANNIIFFDESKIEDN